jgi:thiol-disulfide isomerase/thioredoxin
MAHPLPPMNAGAVVANFYAPWCPWCQRLEPTWEAVTTEVHNRYPESDGRIRFAKVDCTRVVELCRQHHITGFPSIRIYRKGSDDISVQGIHDHETYRGEGPVSIWEMSSTAPYVARSNPQDLSCGCRR